MRSRVEMTKLVGVVVLVLGAVGCQRSKEEIPAAVSTKPVGHERGDCKPATGATAEAMAKRGAELEIRIAKAIEETAAAQTDADRAATKARLVSLQTEKATLEARTATPDTRCDPGLLCLSELCVRPPPADCTIVGESLASRELGNYAPREQRAPLVAARTAACETAMVSKDEAKCLDQAHDKWSLAQCVPRMYPELALTKGASGDCELVVDKMRALMSSEMGQSTDPSIQKMLVAASAAVRASCNEDAWPDGFKQCVLATSIATGRNGMTACEGMMPPGLKDKMSERMQRLMSNQ